MKDTRAESSAEVIGTEVPADDQQRLERLSQDIRRRVNVDAASVEKDLAKLVLGLIEFIRRLLEKQAIRRVEGGDLSPGQIENLGLALLKLESAMSELKRQFGLSDEDIDLDIGPLGRLY